MNNFLRHILVIALIALSLITWSYIKERGVGYSVDQFAENAISDLAFVPPNKLNDNLLAHFDSIFKGYGQWIRKFFHAEMHDQLQEQTRDLMSQLIKKDRKRKVLIIPHHSTYRPRKYPAELPNVTDTLQVFAADMEWVSFQFILFAVQDSITNFKINIGNPVLDSLEVFQMDYVNCTQPNYVVERTGQFADPLIPCKLKAGQYSSYFDVFSVPLRQTKSILINGFSNKVANWNTPMEFTFTISTTKEIIEIKKWVKISLFNFSLPKTITLKTAYSYSERSSAAYYGRKLSYEKQKSNFDFMLRYRLNPTSIYASKPVPNIADWPAYVEKGANFFNLKLLKENQDKEVLKEQIEEIVDNGMERYIYIYGFDEVQVRNYDKLKSAVSSLRSVNRSIPFASSVARNQELDGYVDIWVPQIDNYDPESKLEGEVWTYSCCLPYKPYPNFFIDYPILDSRVVQWINFKFNVSGSLYYAINNWGENGLNHQSDSALWPQKEWKPFTYKQTNGDGQLVYPAPDTSFWPSIRLINLRDGIEDYEYFVMLSDIKRKTDNQELLLQIEEFEVSFNAKVVSYKKYITAPLELLTLRNEAGKLISRYYEGKSNLPLHP